MSVFDLTVTVDIIETYTFTRLREGIVVFEIDGNGPYLERVDLAR